MGGKRKVKKKRSSDTSIRAKTPEQDTSNLDVNIKLEDFEKQYESLLAQIDSVVNKRIKAIEWAYTIALKKIPPEILHSKIQWNNVQTVEPLKEDKSEGKAAKRSRSSSVGSASSSSNTRTTRSNSLGTRIEKNNLTAIKTKYKTPACNAGFSYVPNLITPKVSGNGPLCMIRYPQEGEMAVSLSGSPLMVTPVFHNYKANFNVTLPNGKVMSILPEQGIRPYDLPPLDEDTRRELETLNQTIRAFIDSNKTKK